MCNRFFPLSTDYPSKNKRLFMFEMVALSKENLESLLEKQAN
jgi:hypothetical protein